MRVAVGWYQALREINDKTDGVVDWLLPNTRILVAIRDSKCDPALTLLGTVELLKNAFGGAGVHIILGAGCSGSSMRAAEVAGLLNFPIVSPTSSSPALSSGINYPTFLRLMPTDDLRFAALADILPNLFNRTAVAVVSSSDAFGMGGAVAFVDAAVQTGLEIIVKVVFDSLSDSYGAWQT